MQSAITEETDVYDRTKVEGLLEKLNALDWSREGSVAFLVETPEPHRHALRDRVDVIAGRGFSGDNEQKSFYKGKYVPGREVSAIALEVLLLFGVEPDVPGDNLITEGLDLAALKTGDRIGIGEVVLERSERPHRPCMTFRVRTSPEAYAVASRAGCRGALFTVVKGGSIRPGDPIELLDR